MPRRCTSCSTLAPRSCPAQAGEGVSGGSSLAGCMQHAGMRLAAFTRSATDRPAGAVLQPLPVCRVLEAMVCAHWEALQALDAASPIAGFQAALHDSLVVCMAMGPPALAADDGLHSLYRRQEQLTAEVGGGLRVWIGHLDGVGRGRGVPVGCVQVLCGCLTSSLLGSSPGPRRLDAPHHAAHLRRPRAAPGRLPPGKRPPEGHGAAGAQGRRGWAAGAWNGE